MKTRRAAKYRLVLTGFDKDGYTGTILDDAGYLMYDIDTSVNRKRGNMGVSIIATDTVDLVRNETKIIDKSSIGRAEQPVYEFDIVLSAEDSDGNPSVTNKVRLNEEQADRLSTLLTDRYKGVSI